VIWPQNASRPVLTVGKNSYPEMSVIPLVYSNGEHEIPFDNGIQIIFSSFLAAAQNSSDLETKGATCESSWREKGEQTAPNACPLHE
jgi:hypothetical protein